jgi:hypothetical protein
MASEREQTPVGRVQRQGWVSPAADVEIERLVQSLGRIETRGPRLVTPRPEGSRVQTLPEADGVQEEAEAQVREELMSRFLRTIPVETGGTARLGTFRLSTRDLGASEGSGRSLGGGAARTGAASFGIERDGEGAEGDSVGRQSGRLHVERLSREDMLQRISNYTVVGPTNPKLEYTASDSPIEAEQQIYAMLASCNHEDLLTKRAMFDRIRAELTEKGTEGISDSVLSEMVQQIEEEAPKIPEAILRSAMYARLKAQAHAVQKAALVKIAIAHGQRGEIGREAQALSKKQMEQQIDDGLYRFGQFLKRRIPNVHTSDELFRMEVKLHEAVPDFSSGQSAYISMNALVELYGEMEERLRKKGKACSMSLREMICGAMNRGLYRTASEGRRAYAMSWYMDMERALEEGREKDFDMYYEKTLRRLDERIGEEARSRKVEPKPQDSAWNQGRAVGDSALTGQQEKTRKPSAEQRDQRPTKAMAAVPVVLCRACGEKGHGVLGCEVHPPVAGVDDTFVEAKCHNCEQWGHIASNCKEPKVVKPKHDKKKGEPLNGGGPRQTSESAAGRNL